MKTFKVKLKLNNKQKTQLFKNAGVYRFAYNFSLALIDKHYQETKKFLSDSEIRKYITELKKSELNWLYEFDCDIVKQSVKDACKAYKNFFKTIKNKKTYRKGSLKKKKINPDYQLTYKDLIGFPRFKSKKKIKPSFYVDGWKLKVQEGYIKIPYCSKIKLYEKGYIPQGLNYQNPRISYNGIDWFLSVGLSIEEDLFNLTDEIVGIDLGLKELATCSNGITIHNISKSKTYRKLEKSIKQKQRQVSRKYELNKQKDKFVKTNNIIKLEKRIQKKRIKQENIKQDYFHKNSTMLVKTKPQCIVLEDLNIKGLMKNKHQSKAWQQSSVSMFKRMLINKALSHGIEVVLADKFYPSTQLCSNCGSRRSIKLSERTYKCPNCGLIIDRDFNASINLKHYREFPERLSLWRAKPTKVA